MCGIIGTTNQKISNSLFSEALGKISRRGPDNQGFLTDDVYYQMAELYNYNLNKTEKAKEYYQKIIFDHSSSIYLVEAKGDYIYVKTEEKNYTVHSTLKKIEDKLPANLFLKVQSKHSYFLLCY